jgi:2-polyprenyl-6-methoxyphenol hydroxylase-like FAD-dependent oxidoreductase
VLLIEKAPQFRAGGYMIDFWGVGYTLAERMGILGRVLDAGYTVERLRFIGARGRETARVSSEAWRRLTGNRFTSLPRGDLAKAVYDQVAGKIETIFGDTINALEDKGTALTIHFDRQPARAVDLLIGADGLHSNVRRLVFGDESRFEKRFGYYVAAFKARGYEPRDENVYVMWSAPGLQVSRFAMRDGRTMFLLVFTADRLSGAEPRSPADEKAALHRVFGDVGWECPRILAAMDQADEIYFDRVAQIRMDAWSKGRSVLVGDAAACASLLAGEGTGLALTEAYVLAGELGAARGDYTAAFRRYEERLRPFIEGKQRSAERFASSFAPKTSLGVWLRNQAVRLMAIPGVAGILMGRTLSDDFDLPHYLS